MALPSSRALRSSFLHRFFGRSAALLLLAFAVAFDAFVAIPFRRSGLRRFARSLAPLRPNSEK